MFSSVLSTLAFLFGLTIILVIDYFPSMFPRNSIYLAAILFVISIIISIYLEKRDKYKSKEVKIKQLILEIISLIFFISLVISLTLLGGKSSETNITISSPILWIVIIISIKQLYSHWVQLKSKD